MMILDTNIVSVMMRSATAPRVLDFDSASASVAAQLMARPAASAATRHRPGAAAASVAEEATQVRFPNVVAAVGGPTALEAIAAAARASRPAPADLA